MQNWSKLLEDVLTPISNANNLYFLLTLIFYCNLKFFEAWCAIYSQAAISDPSIIKCKSCWWSVFVGPHMLALNSLRHGVQFILKQQYLIHQSLNKTLSSLTKPFLFWTSHYFPITQASKKHLYILNLGKLCTIVKHTIDCKAK